MALPDRALAAAGVPPIPRDPAAEAALPGDTVRPGPGVVGGTRRGGMAGAPRLGGGQGGGDPCRGRPAQRQPARCRSDRARRGPAPDGVGGSPATVSRVSGGVRRSGASGCRRDDPGAAARRARDRLRTPCRRSRHGPGPVVGGEATPMPDRGSSGIPRRWCRALGLTSARLPRRPGDEDPDEHDADPDPLHRGEALGEDESVPTARWRPAAAAASPTSPAPGAGAAPPRSAPIRRPGPPPPRAISHPWAGQVIGEGEVGVEGRDHEQRRRRRRPWCRAADRRGGRVAGWTPGT